MPYYPGQSLKLRATFTVDGAVTDPTSITLIVRDPAGTSNTYTYAGATITKDSTGIYSKNVAFDSEGTWRWRWVGTGTVVASAEGEVVIEVSVFV